MQVQPITAIRPIKIRPRPTGGVPAAHERDARSHAEFIPAPRNEPHPANAVQTDIHAHAVSNYTAQLLITHQAAAQTAMDRSAQMARYRASEQTVHVVPQVSLSV